MICRDGGRHHGAWSNDLLPHSKTISLVERVAGGKSSAHALAFSVHCEPAYLFGQACRFAGLGRQSFPKPGPSFSAEFDRKTCTYCVVRNGSISHDVWTRGGRGSGWHGCRRWSRQGLAGFGKQVATQRLLRRQLSAHLTFAILRVELVDAIQLSITVIHDSP